MTLTGSQKRFLRGLGHALHPVVMVGREGVSDAVKSKTRIELEHHELIKVRAGDGCLESAQEVGEALASSTGSALVQTIGHTVLLYRRHPSEPVIKLPSAAR